MVARDDVRMLLRIAFRNLLASRVRTAILGGIVLVGSFLVVLGASFIDTIDRGMRTSVQGSLAGHLQVYRADSKDPLELYGGLRGESLLEPIEDFAKVKEVLSRVPNVKMVVPMGIDQAMVATGNVMDVALERLRADVRRLEEGDASPEARVRYEAHRAQVRRMVSVLRDELGQARVIADLEGREGAERREEWADLGRATSDAFWDGFDRDRYGNLEFLENRIAKLSFDTAFTFLRYVGTDVDAFFRAFPLAEISKGERIPPGRRGILVGQQYAEEWLKLRNARRLDLIREARARGRRIADDDELRRWVEENRDGTRDILLQLDPAAAGAVATALRAELGAEAAREELPALLVRLFDTTDPNFDGRYALFYRVLAPRLRLYLVDVGDTITIKAPAKSGYFNAVNVKVYGFVRFHDIEKSGVAGMMSVLDLLTFRDLYGYLTRERAAEQQELQRSVGAAPVSREEAEAKLFGGGEGPVEAEARPVPIDEGRVLRGAGRVEDLSARVYTQDEIDRGVVLNAAIVLDDPGRLRETLRDVQAASDAAGLKLRVIDWKQAAGLVGQFLDLLRAVLLFFVVAFFGVTLVIINNAMVMATLQRVREIGTMRAIGAQRRFVLAMLLVETTAAGVLFGLAGAALGGVAVRIVRASGGIAARNDFFTFMFSGPALLPRLGTGTVLFSLAIVLGVSILSGLYPALIAMRVTPVEAMAAED